MLKCITIRIFTVVEFSPLHSYPTYKQHNKYLSIKILNNTNKNKELRIMNKVYAQQNMYIFTVSNI